MNLNYFLFLLFISSIVNAQKSEINYWINENGKSITMDSFLSEWRSDKSDFARWDYSTKDSVRVARITHQKFETYEVQPNYFVDYFEGLTGEIYPKNSIFLVEYRFLNDYCEGIPDNSFTSDEMERKVNFIEDQIKNVQRINSNVAYLIVFEEGIKFHTSKKINEYYFTDKNSFLRKSVFLNPSLCGSFLILKPDGKALVRNGEFNATMMAECLKPKNWDSIFK